MKDDARKPTGSVRAPILIVDDRPADLAAVADALSNLGDPIVRAASGQEALAALLRSDFAVILLDVRMPEMDGLETAAYIRQGKRSKLTPIIFVTAGDDDLGEVLRGYSAGAVDYIRKPIQTEVLRSKVRVFAELFHKATELERVNAELRAAYRNLEVFSYAVAHEFRSPLRAMTGFSQILREQYSERPLDQEGQDYARRIEDGATRMDALVQDLLAYCSVARTKVETGTVDAGEVVRESVDALRPALAQASAEVQVSENFPRLVANKALLALALSHLLSNALKFVPEGVRPRIRVGHDRRRDRVRIWVEDNGVGIAPVYQERIFGVFERLLEPHGTTGNGIGLALTKAAAERMGGSVGVLSAPGRGSTFWVELAGVPLQEILSTNGTRHETPADHGDPIPENAS